MGAPYITVITVHLHFPENGSLKGKRRELASLKALLSRRFRAAVAEVDHHDLWQRATLAVALVGAELGAVEQLADRVEAFLRSRFVDLRTERDSVSLADLRSLDLQGP